MYFQVPGASVGRGSVNAEAVEFGGSNMVAGYCWFSGDIRIGFGTRIGVSAIIDGPLTIGRYCSIGGHVSIGAAGHPMETAAMFNAPLLFDGRRRTLVAPAQPTVIGHDVWIGAGVRILAGVTIGNGAVVGGGSVVTRDVPPFTVVVGAPAKPVRTRFSPEVADLVTALAWWDRSPEELGPYEELLARDLVSDPVEAADLLRTFLAEHAGSSKLPADA